MNLTNVAYLAWHHTITCLNVERLLGDFEFGLFFVGGGGGAKWAPARQTLPHKQVGSISSEYALPRSCTHVE